MNYKIIIEKKEPNKNFEAEYAEWKDRNTYTNPSRYPEGAPSRETITNALMVELTEEQYKAVKAAVMQAFE